MTADVVAEEDPTARRGTEGRRIAGVDVGKSTLKLVIVRFGASSAPRIEVAEQGAHDGAPADLLATWYATHDVGACDAMGATGLYGDDLPKPTLIEYLTEEESAELLGLPTDFVRASTTRILAKRIKSLLYERVRRLHPWLPAPDVPDALAHAEPLIGRDPLGEAPITVGTVMQAWEDGICDGVVVLGPWGCGPALIAESILRHQRHVPIHFHYGDGSPMDERRLNAFAHRLRREPRRAEHAWS